MRRRLVVGVGVLLTLFAPGTVFVAPAMASAPLTPGEAGQLAMAPSQPDIVIFKNQHPEAPASPTYAAQRDQVEHADRAGVLNELQEVRARDLHQFRVVNALSATISSSEASRLRNDPQVQAVVPDIAYRAPRFDASPAPDEVAAPVSTPTTGRPDQSICPSDSKNPLLEPEALQVMNVEFQSGERKPAAHDLVDGSGVKVGILANGLDINNPDLQRNGKSVVFDYQDFSGYGNDAPTGGLEAFADSGAIAAQGNTTYDLSKFVNPAHPLPANCNMRIKGIAPGASLAMFNVFGSTGDSFESQIVQAIDRAVFVDKVNVLNECIAGLAIPDTNDDAFTVANKNAVAAGVTVVASSGDGGPTNTIGYPASDPGIIAVGGSTTLRAYRQDTRYGTQLKPGGWLDNNISAVSSGGTTQFGPRTVDVVAPADLTWSICSPDAGHYTDCDAGKPISGFWGTSFSTPLTSGTAALVIQAYAKTHGGAYPSPALVKQIIVSSAADLGAPADHQGAGLVNALKAVQLAEAIDDGHGSPAAQGSGLLLDQTSLISVKPVGLRPTYKLGVTNQGSKPQTIRPTLTSLGPKPLWSDDGSITLNTQSPTFFDSRGITNSYQIHQFNVPAGTDYLNGNIAWDALG
ncbi:MAG: S8 family serine peptidase, partial [Candidatus Dormibacteraceae bacterium]